MRAHICAAGLGLLFLAGPVAATEPPTAAVFDFELIDTSLQGEVSGAREDERRRLILVSERLRADLAAAGRVRPIDTGPAAAAIADAGYLHGCNGCTARIADDLGADLAVTGTVQKVSNLILNINVSVVEAATGRHVTGASVDIRGNTDQSWIRGVSYLVRNRLFRGDRR